MNEMQDSSHEKKKRTSKFLILGLVCALVGAPLLGGLLAMTKKQVDMETVIGTGWNDDLENALLDTGYKGKNPTDEDENLFDTQSRSLSTRAKKAEEKVKQLLTSLEKMRTVNNDKSKKMNGSTSNYSNDDTQLNQLRDEILRLQNEIQTLQTQVTNSPTPVVTTTHTTINSGEVSNITNQIEMVEKKILIQTERLLEVEQEKTASLSGEVSELEERKGQLETEISDLKNTVDDTTLNNLELKKTVETKDQELDKLNKNLDASKNESVLLRDELGNVYDASVENNTLIFTPHVTQTQKAES